MPYVKKQCAIFKILFDFYSYSFQQNYIVNTSVNTGKDLARQGQNMAKNQVASTEHPQLTDTRLLEITQSSEYHGYLQKSSTNDSKQDIEDDRHITITSPQASDQEIGYDTLITTETATMSSHHRINNEMVTDESLLMYTDDYGVPPMQEASPPQVQEGPLLQVQEGPPLQVQEGPPPQVQEGPPPPMQEGPPPQVQEAPQPPLQEGPPPQVQEGPPPQVQEAPPPPVQEDPPPQVQEAPTPQVQEDRPPQVQEAPTPQVQEGPPPQVQEAPPPPMQEGPSPQVQEAPPPPLQEQEAPAPPLPRVYTMEENNTFMYHFYRVALGDDMHFPVCKQDTCKDYCSENGTQRLV